MKHAILGASSSKRWLRCTMSAAAEAPFPNEESEFAAEGTFGHALAEAWLAVYLSGNDGAEIYAAEELAKSEDGQKYLTPEFAEAVQSYVDYVVERYERLVAQHGRQNVQFFLEERLDFSRWVPEGFGTGDTTIVYPGGVLVCDLKMGQGIEVDGVNNSQLRLYALGAYDRYNTLYDIEEVETVVHQPRLHNVSGDKFAVRELLTWAEELVRPRAAIAWAAVQGDTTLARFSPGEHCASTFCRARFTCPARARHALEEAEKPWAFQDPTQLTVDQLESLVGKARAITKWANDIERYLISRAATGEVQLQRYELVEGRIYRSITDAQAAAAVLIKNGFRASDIYKDPELKNLTTLEKLVGPKRLAELLGDTLTKPPGKPTLAPRGSGKQAVPVQGRAAAADEFDQV